MHLVIKRLSKSSAFCLVAIILLLGSFAPFVEHAQAQPYPGAPIVAAAANAVANGVASNSGWSCSSLGSCLAGLVYIVPALSAYIAYIAAYFFDIIAQLSLQSSAYSLNFLATGWQTALSVANMAFLFILIFIAITIMFQAETGGTMRMLGTLILMALLVNFSFFITRVVIDAGNLLAVQFYNAQNLPAFHPPDYLTNIANGATGTPTGSGGPVVGDLTAPIMNAVNLQGLFSNTTFQDFISNNKNFVGTLNQIITLSFLFIAVAVIYWILIFTFMFAGVKLLLRIVVLWFVLITSPLAFAVAALSSGGGPAKQAWEHWKSALIQFSIYPAAFFFIFYVVAGTVNSIAGANGGIYTQIFSDLNSNFSSTSIIDSVAVVVVRMGIIIAVIYFALKGADMVAVEGNKFAESVVGRVTGFAANTARGAASRAGGVGGFAFQRSVGRGAEAMDRSLASTRFGNERFGYWLRRNTVQRVSNASVGGVESRVQFTTRAEKERKERAAGMRDIENQRLTTQVRAKVQNRQLTTPDEEKRVQNFGKRELEEMTTRELTPLVHLLSEKQMKILEESNQFTDAEREQLRNAWHAIGTQQAPLAPPQQQQAQQPMPFGSKNNPINKSLNQLEKITNIQANPNNHIPGNALLNTTSGAHITKTGIENIINAHENRTSALELNRNTAQLNYAKSQQDLVDVNQKLQTAARDLVTARANSDFTTINRLQGEIVKHQNDIRQHAADSITHQNTVATNATDLRVTNNLIQSLKDLQKTMEDVQGHSSHVDGRPIPAGEIETR